MPDATEELAIVQEHTWEDRSLNVLDGSYIDQEFSQATWRKRRKHKLKWMKKPMAIPSVILELLDVEHREKALRALGNFLVEKRKQDPDNYDRTGFLLFYSCATMSILLEEIIGFYGKMISRTFTTRTINRLANVLTLFQSIAANFETREKFVDCCFPNLLVPIILFEKTIKEFDTIRAIALSVIGILCQGQDNKMIQWALESDIVEVCCTVVMTGNELSQVIAMHILESILLNQWGILYICDPAHDKLLQRLTATWKQLVDLLVEKSNFSPRLVFHVCRCYVILCAHPRGLDITVDCLHHAIANNFFHEIAEEYPLIRTILNQLLLSVGHVAKDLKPQEHQLI